METNAPEVLWDYGLEWCALVRSHTAHNIRSLDGRVPATRVTGDTADISHLAEFGWYDWVWFVEHKTSDGQEETREPSNQRKRLGRYLGNAENVGSAMCGTVLTEKATTLDRTSIIPLSLAEKNSDDIKARKETFQSRLAAKLKDRIAGMKSGKDPIAMEDAELELQREEWAREATPEYEPYEQWDPSELGFEDMLELKPRLPDIE